MADKYLTSCTFADAKELWNSRIRVYNASLQRGLVASLQSVDATKRKELHDTGFLKHYVTSVNNPFQIGTQTVIDYIKSNPGRETIVSGSTIPYHFYYSTQAAFDVAWSSTAHPCYSPTGSHIGSGADCSVSVPNPTKDVKLRFKNSSGTPLTIVPWEATNSRFAVPILDETIPIYWVGAYLYHWRNSSWYGEALVDFLVGNGINPVGVVCDWEDYTCYLCDDCTPSLKSFYLADPRFASDSNTLFFSKIVLMQDARLTAIRGEVSSWANDNYCSFPALQDAEKDADETFAHPWLKINNRPAVSVYLYPYWDHYTDVKDVVLKKCIELTDFYTRGKEIHNFHLWVCAGADSAGVDIYNPTQNSLSVSDTIGMTKLFISLGGNTINFFNSTVGSQHGYWSGLIAYDEMQIYADVIKNGQNHKPANNRKYTGDVTWYNNKNSLFYDVGNGNLFITCRYTADEMVFCGFSTDKTYGSLSVLDPAGVSRSVAYSPYSEITFIRRNSMGYGPVVLSSITTADIVSPAAPAIISVQQITNSIVRVTLSMPVTDSGGGSLSGLTKLTVATISGSTAFTGKSMTEILALPGVAKVDVVLTPAAAGQQKVVDIPVTNLGGAQSIAAACSD